VRSLDWTTFACRCGHGVKRVAKYLKPPQANVGVTDYFGNMKSLHSTVCARLIGTAYAFHRLDRSNDIRIVTLQ
jgi:hypothetical protein